MENVSNKSEFNDAIGQINRINFALFDVWQGKSNRDAFKYYNGIIAFFSELSTYLKEEDAENLKNIIITLNDQVSKSIRISQSTGNSSIDFSLFTQLLDIELKLRRIYDASGLQSKKKDDLLDSEESW
jgi:hypothetical protein